MPKRVHKYLLPMTREVFDMELPKRAKFLNLTNQSNKPYLYALVDMTERRELRRLALVPTGADVPHDVHYVDTAVFESGKVVVHLFELPPTAR